MSTFNIFYMKAKYLNSCLTCISSDLYILNVKNGSRYMVATEKRVKKHGHNLVFLVAERVLCCWCF